MDRSTACRIAVCMWEYVEICDDGRQVSHSTRDFQLVVDRDTTNVKDLLVDLSMEVKHGTNQGMTLTYWNKRNSIYSTISSDSQLLDALDLYWDIRRLPLIVTVYDTVSLTYSQQQTSQSTEEQSSHIVFPAPSHIGSDSGHAATGGEGHGDASGEAGIGPN